MNLIVAHIKWVMLLSGVLTCTMIYAAIAPQAALVATFGEGLEGPLADIVVRNWGVLITLIGAMLIYGAFNPGVRSFALVIAGVSKIVFIVLVLSHGTRYLGSQAATAVAIDAVWVIIFACYLLATRSAMLFSK
jgi:hypothetical protein